MLFRSSIYKDAKASETEATSIELPFDSTFEMMPTTPQDSHERQSIFIGGASGSGKSYFIKSYLSLYHEKFPKNKLYLVSQAKQDKKIDSENLPIKKLNEEDIMGTGDETPLSWEDFPEKCIVVFDDWDQMLTKDKKLGKIVQNLVDDLLSLARKKYISVIISSHYLNNYRASRMIMNECSHFVLFPHGASFHSLEYLLRMYAGLSKDQILTYVKNNPSRWVVIHKQYPLYILTQFDCHLLK